VLDEDGSPRDGLFVRILSNDFESDGVRRVQLDLDGSGEAAVANDYEELEISDRERELLSTETSQDGGIDGALRTPGDVLLRTAIDHFSPHDLNVRVVFECENGVCPDGGARMASN